MTCKIPYLVMNFSPGLSWLNGLVPTAALLVGLFVLLSWHTLCSGGKKNKHAQKSRMNQICVKGCNWLYSNIQSFISRRNKFKNKTSILFLCWIFFKVKRSTFNDQLMDGDPNWKLKVADWQYMNPATVLVFPTCKFQFWIVDVEHVVINWKLNVEQLNLLAQ